MPYVLGPVTTRLVIEGVSLRLRALLLGIDADELARRVSEGEGSWDEVEMRMLGFDRLEP